jgi:hypothetical protein
MKYFKPLLFFFFVLFGAYYFLPIFFGFNSDNDKFDTDLKDFGLKTSVIEENFMLEDAYAASLTPQIHFMKLVNENVSNADLDAMQKLGVNVVGGEWGMDEAKPEAIAKLMDRILARKMKLIINFSDGSAWGYREDGTDSPDKRPVWQSGRIARYVKILMLHPALFGYDISNEAGENLPNGEKFRITLKDMRLAGASIRAIDAKHPLILRMRYWDEYDRDFTEKNPFEKGIADIAMLNLYSNYSENGKQPLLPGMIANDGQKLVNKIKKADPKIKIWISLSAFRENPDFLLPAPDNFKRDLSSTMKIKGISGVGFFGWGPERYPENRPDGTCREMEKICFRLLLIFLKLSYNKSLRA